jgi:hypothetical protein
MRCLFAPNGCVYVRCFAPFRGQDSCYLVFSDHGMHLSIVSETEVEARLVSFPLDSIRELRVLAVVGTRHLAGGVSILKHSSFLVFSTCLNTIM